MASFNKVILIGNLARDPEVRFIGSGTAVCEVALAVNRKWFDKATSQKKEEVAFVDCTFWGKKAEVLKEYCQKGSPLLVEGYLKQDSWEDKDSGQKRSKLKVNVEQMEFLGGGSRGQSQGPQDAPHQDDIPAEDEVPF